MGEQAGSGQGERDTRTHDELLRALTLAGWSMIHWDYGSDGVAVTFEKEHRASETDAPRRETRTVHGADEDDAMRKFLAELAEQEAS